MATACSLALHHGGMFSQKQLLHILLLRNQPADLLIFHTLEEKKEIFLQQTAQKEAGETPHVRP
jgi:hypothetical protein